MEDNRPFNIGEQYALDVFDSAKLEDLAGVLAGFRKTMSELLRELGPGDEFGPLRDAMIQIGCEPSIPNKVLAPYDGQEAGSDCVSG